MTESKGGRQAYQPTDENRRMVEVLAGFGIPTKKIADVLNIAQPTVLKYFRAELDRGAAVVEAKLVGNLLRLANGADGTALKAVMFSLTTRFGWSAYVPRPKTEEPLGKKEQAQIAAETAHEDTEWSGLVN